MLPEMLEDPYVEVAPQAPPSLDYISGPEEPEQAPPSPDYIPGPEHSPKYVPESDFEAHPKDDDEEDPEEDPVDYLADGGDDGDDEEESSEDDKDDDMDIEADEEEEEEHPAPADSVVVAPTAADHAPSMEETEPFETDESATTPPPHPAYHMTARISIPAPVHMPAWTDSEIVRVLAMSSPPLSPLSPWSSPPPQILPIRSLGYKAAMIRLRAEAAYTSSPPLQLPSASRREDRPEVNLPPKKRLVETLQGAPVSTDTELGGYIREFETRVRQDTDEIYMRLDDEQTERQLLAGRLNMLFRDRRAHAYTCHLMETEARMSREAWVRSKDASDLVRGEVMSLRTTELGQMSEIRELQATDRKRQTMISELLRTDHRRSIEVMKLRTSLQGQELALLCERMFFEESDKIEKYIGGLRDMIHESVVASKPKTMQEAIEIATELMDKKIRTFAERETASKRKFENTSRNTQNQHQQSNKR
nr:hypothetical protein [Tanacetum cinerariifolium]